jgi:5-methylcytosine-specific restriction protein A
MGERPPTACRTPGCPGHASERGYCEACQSKLQPAPGQTRRMYDRQREWKSLYDSSRWRHPASGLRAACLRKYPICVKCNRNPSVVADHKIDHRGNPILFYDFENLQGLCKGCHDEKTGSEHGGKGYVAPKPALVEGKIRDYSSKP